MVEIIAEIGVNHLGDMALAKYMIGVAKSIGIKTVKFQLYDVDKLFPTHEIMAQGRNWYPEVKKAQLDKEQVFELANYCKQLNIKFFASCFDLERLSWLEELKVRRHKVATRANQDRDLIYAMMKTGKEILVSCRPNDKIPIALGYNVKWLYCIPEYPTPLKLFKLLSIDFSVYHGVSIHYPGIEPAVVAISRGAQIVEVHFCLSRKSITNPDITSSLEPRELEQLVKFARKAEVILSA